MFIPIPKPHDGSPTGNSYLSLWLACRRKWFARYVWPHPGGEAGLATPHRNIRLGKRGLEGPGANLILGSMLHTYKEMWYRSGIKDGEDTGQYDHEFALEALQSYTVLRSQEFETPEAEAWALTAVKSWGEAFHRFFGPEGHTPLFPEERILCLEDGRPAIELELAVPLGFGDYVYTSRLDAVALWQNRYVIGVETKSAAPSWVDRYINQLPKSAQFTGEMFVMRNAEALRELPWDKLRVAFHLKGWTPKSTFPSPVQFGDVSRTPEQLERFRKRVVGILAQIDVTMETWTRGLERGDDPVLLRDTLFPETGEHTGACYAFNSECEYYGPCQLGFSPGSLGGYRPARKPGEVPLDAPTQEEA